MQEAWIKFSKDVLEVAKKDPDIRGLLSKFASH